MRYIKPLETERPARSDRFDAFSPKLGRPLTLFSYSQFQQWLLLEALPSVKAFCERPALLESEDQKPVLIDFWIQGATAEFFLVIRDDGTPTLKQTGADSLRVRYIKHSRLDSWGMFAQNWQSMLPYIVAYRHWLTNNDTVDLINRCSSRITLGELENAYPSKEPSWVRACVFDALAKGSLQAPSLKSKPWNRFLQISPRGRHAD
jgi:hypothetical protein